MSLRVLVVDDAILFRRVISDALAAIPGVEVVGTATNGRFALQKVRDLKPDLVTLDLEMPEMDGLTTLDAFKASGVNVQTIVVSALTRAGGDLTMRALQKGAFDFITKPDAGGPDESRQALIRELTPRVKALIHRLEVRSILRTAAGPAAPAAPAAKVPAAAPAPAAASAGGLDAIASRMGRIASPSRPEMVLIGVSTGGPAALAELLPSIPADIGVPILIVQHMPPIFTQSLADSLAAKCAVKVREAVHGEPAAAGVAYIAPGGRHMRLALGGADPRPRIEITEDPPENNCRPAVDYLFRSAASYYPGRSTAVILTGMGNDGTLGLRLLKRHGCFVIAQDEASCVVYGMPKSAVDAGVVDSVLPLGAIAGRLISAVRGR